MATESLDTVVVDLDTFIRELFDLLGHSWQFLARELEFSETDIAALEHDYQFSFKEQIHQMFHQWKRREGNGATKERLLLAMKAAGFDEQVKILSQKGVIKTQNSSAHLASSLAAGVRFPIQASDDAHTDSPVRARTAPTTPPTSGSPSQRDFIRQQRLKRFSTSASNPVDSSEQRTSESDDSVLSPTGAATRKECSLLLSSSTTAGSQTSEVSDHDSNVVLSANKAKFEVDDVIQVDRPDSAPWYGVIRWIGTLPGSTILSAGIEMETVVNGGGCGSFQNFSYFSCREGHGLFLPLSRLRRDTRFHEGDGDETSAREPVTSKTSQQGGESASTTNTQDPISDLLSKLMGDSKGASPPESEASESKGYELHIPADRAGLVIGTGGKNIREVERLTNTSIKVESGIGSLGGNRKVLVLGSEENCKKALLMILRNVERRVSEHTAGAKTISVPDSLVGRIIGKGGATISTIKSISGAHDIKIDDKKTGLGAMLQTERECHIHGSEEAIKKAEELIRLAMTGADVIKGATIAAIFVELMKLGVECQEESS